MDLNQIMCVQSMKVKEAQHCEAGSKEVLYERVSVLS